MRGQLSIGGGDQAAEPVVRDGYCECGCGRSVAGWRDGTRFASAACRQRHYRKRVKAEMERVGLPASPSLRAAGVSHPARARNGDAESAPNTPQRARSGLQVSYRKAVEVLHAELGASKLSIELALERALPARQRATLEDRESR